MANSLVDKDLKPSKKRNKQNAILSRITLVEFIIGLPSLYQLIDGKTISITDLGGGSTRRRRRTNKK